MPIYEVQGPDGRIYEIEAPDEQSVYSFFENTDLSTIPNSQPAAPPPQVEPLDTEPRPTDATAPPPPQTEPVDIPPADKPFDGKFISEQEAQTADPFKDWLGGLVESHVRGLTGPDAITPKNIVGQAGSGIVRGGEEMGLYGVPGMVGNTLQSVGDAVDSETIRNTGKWIEDNVPEPEKGKYEKTLQSIWDVESVADFANWAGFAAGSGAASSVIPLITGATGTIVGGVATPGTPQAKAVGAAIGGGLGAFGGSNLLMIGEMRQALEDEGIDDPALLAKYSLLGGAALSLPEAVNPGRWAQKLIGGTREAAMKREMKQLMKSVARRAGEEYAKSGTIEGFTEALQDEIKERFINSATGRPYEFDPKERSNAFLMGFFGGGPMGAGAGTVQAIRDRREGPEPDPFLVDEYIRKRQRQYEADSGVSPDDDGVSEEQQEAAEGEPEAAPEAAPEAPEEESSIAPASGLSDDEFFDLVDRDPEAAAEVLQAEQQAEPEPEPEAVEPEVQEPDTPPETTYVEERKPRKVGPQSVAQVLGRAGGIGPTWSEDVKFLLGRDNQFLPGIGPLIREKGINEEAAVDALVEAGFIRPEDAQNFGKNDILDLLEKDFAGQKQYTAEDQAIIDEREYAQAYEEQQAQFEQYSEPEQEIIKKHGWEKFDRFSSELASWSGYTNQPDSVAGLLQEGYDLDMINNAVGRMDDGKNVWTALDEAVNEEEERAIYGEPEAEPQPAYDEEVLGAEGQEPTAESERGEVTGDEGEVVSAGEERQDDREESGPKAAPAEEVEDNYDDLPKPEGVDEDDWNGRKGFQKAHAAVGARAWDTVRQMSDSDAASGINYNYEFYKGKAKDLPKFIEEANAMMEEKGYERPSDEYLEEVIGKFASVGSFTKGGSKKFPSFQYLWPRSGENIHEPVPGEHWWVRQYAREQGWEKFERGAWVATDKFIEEFEEGPESGRKKSSREPIAAKEEEKQGVSEPVDVEEGPISGKDAEGNRRFVGYDAPGNLIRDVTVTPKQMKDYVDGLPEEKPISTEDMGKHFDVDSMAAHTMLLDMRERGEVEIHTKKRTGTTFKPKRAKGKSNEPAPSPPKAAKEDQERIDTGLFAKEKKERGEPDPALYDVMLEVAQEYIDTGIPEIQELGYIIQNKHRKEKERYALPPEEQPIFAGSRSPVPVPPRPEEVEFQRKRLKEALAKEEGKSKVQEVTDDEASFEDIFKLSKASRKSYRQVKSASEAGMKLPIVDVLNAAESAWRQGKKRLNERGFKKYEINAANAAEMPEVRELVKQMAFLSGGTERLLLDQVRFNDGKIDQERLDKLFEDVRKTIKAVREATRKAKGDIDVGPDGGEQLILPGAERVRKVEHDRADVDRAAEEEAEAAEGRSEEGQDTSGAGLFDQDTAAESAETKTLEETKVSFEEANIIEASAETVLSAIDKRLNGLKALKECLIK